MCKRWFIYQCIYVTLMYIRFIMVKSYIFVILLMCGLTTAAAVASNESFLDFANSLMSDSNMEVDNEASK